MHTTVWMEQHLHRTLCCTEGWPQLSQILGARWYGVIGPAI